MAKSYRVSRRSSGKVPRRNSRKVSARRSSRRISRKVPARRSSRKVSARRSSRKVHKGSGSGSGKGSLTKAKAKAKAAEEKEVAKAAEAKEVAKAAEEKEVAKAAEAKAADFKNLMKTIKKNTRNIRYSKNKKTHNRVLRTLRLLKGKNPITGFNIEKKINKNVKSLLELYLAKKIKSKEFGVMSSTLRNTGKGGINYLLRENNFREKYPTASAAYEIFLKTKYPEESNAIEKIKQNKNINKSKFTVLQLYNIRDKVLKNIAKVNPSERNRVLKKMENIGLISPENAQKEKAAAEAAFVEVKKGKTLDKATQIVSKLNELREEGKLTNTEKKEEYETLSRQLNRLLSSNYMPPEELESFYIKSRNIKKSEARRYKTPEEIESEAEKIFTRKTNREVNNKFKDEIKKIVETYKLPHNQSAELEKQANNFIKYAKKSAFEYIKEKLLKAREAYPNNNLNMSGVLNKADDFMEKQREKAKVGARREAIKKVKNLPVQLLKGLSPNLQV